MKIAFRLDDITPDMDMSKFNKICEIFDKVDLRPLIGVVPDCQDKLLHYEEARSDFWGMVYELQQKGWIIAQHGYQHMYETKDSGLLGINPFSEFAGVSYERQLYKLQRGKAILEENGIVSDVFMAPGHTYDTNTIKALKECGFRYLSDGYTKQNYRYNEVCFIPCRNEKKYIADGINTICLHTNLMQDADFIELEKNIRNNRDSYVDFEVLQREEAVRFTFLCRIEQWLALKKYVSRRKLGQSNIAQKYFVKCRHSNAVMRKINRIVYAPMLLGIVFEKDKNE